MSTQSALAADRYVSKDGDDTANDCSNEASPCATIQRGIDQAAGGDTVNIEAGTYEENISFSNKALTIQGEDAKTTIIDAGSNDRGILITTIFQNFQVSISNLTVINGDAAGAGGGIGVFANNNEDVDLVLSNVEIKDSNGSSGGGLYHGSPGTGDLSLSNVTISGNTAEDGGGILVFGSGDASLDNVTISGNDVVSTPPDDEGGGIWTNGMDFTINNSTIANNTAGTNLGGGIFIENGTVTVQNSIVADNTGGDCEEALTSSGNNISSDSSCGLNDASDQEDTDPKLGELGDKGGSLQSLALLAESPAINAGDNASCESADIRGITRPQQDTCDIGAYEASCGDSIKQGTEACDDGNTENGDGCSALCAIETDSESESENNDEDENSGSNTPNSVTVGGCNLIASSDFFHIVWSFAVGLVFLYFLSRKRKQKQS